MVLLRRGQHRSRRGGRRLEAPGGLEAPDTQHQFQRHVAVAAFQQPGIGVEPARLEGFDLLTADPVHLVQDDDVRHIQLLHGQLRHVAFEALELLGVDHREDAVDGQRLAELRIAQGVGDLRWIRHSAGLDHDVLRPILPVVQQAAELFNEITLHSAADAAVGQADGGLGLADDQLAIDIDGTEVVDHHRHAQAVVAGEDAVQQGGLAGAEEAGHQGHGNRVLSAHAGGPQRIFGRSRRQVAA
ncbi:hypothetical protein D3C85_1020390 [compost metagenome]